MELYIFNSNLEFLGVLDNFNSLRWVRRYYKTGEFELHCSITLDTLTLFQKENIIYKKGDVEAGFIEYRNLKQNTDGTEVLVIKGKFLTSYLNRRIIWGTEIFNTTTEIAMRTLVNKNAIVPTDTSRTINNLMLGTLNNFTQNINYQVSYKNLSEELESLSSLSELGHRVRFDLNSKKLVFEVYKGLNRSVNQSSNSRAIFSQEFENILEQQYTDSLNNYRNVNLVAGAGEGNNRKFTTVGSGIGLDRFELFTDARDLSNTKYIDNTEVVIPDIEYIPMLQSRGYGRLSDYSLVETFDSKINIYSNLTYKVDFDLGDIVTCKSKKWGITLNTRITEIEEIYEETGEKINVTFGNNVPTLIDKIKQKLK